MNQGSSSSNIQMTRSTAEAINLYKKQGLSISIVGNEDPNVPKDGRSKQNVILEQSKVSQRPFATPEPQNSQSRTNTNQSTNIRPPTNQLLTNKTSQDIKTPVNQNKSNTLSTSLTEQRPFGAQTWNNANCSQEPKSQSYNILTQQNARPNISDRLQSEGKGQINQNRTPLNSPPLDIRGSNLRMPLVQVLEKTPTTKVLQTPQSKVSTGRVTGVKAPVTIQEISSTRGSGSDNRLQSPPSLSPGVNDRLTNSIYHNEGASAKKDGISEVKSGGQLPHNISITTSAFANSNLMHSSAKSGSQFPVGYDEYEYDDTDEEYSDMNIMAAKNCSTPRTGLKRTHQISLSEEFPRKAAKISSEEIRLSSDTDILSSDEGSPNKEQKFMNLKGLPAGLAITPIQSAPKPKTAVRISTSSVNPDPVVICEFCKQCSFNREMCDSCHKPIPSNSRQYIIKKAATNHSTSSVVESSSSIVVTKNVTTSIEKKIVLQFPEVITQKQSYHIQTKVQRGNVLIGGSRVVQVQRGRGRRRKQEPVCLTLSSDDEEPIQEQFHHLYDAEVEERESEQSSTSEFHEESQELEDGEYPGVTEIDPANAKSVRREHVERAEEQQEVQYHVEEEEECEEEEAEETDVREHRNIKMVGKKILEVPIMCRSIRIGGYKIHPQSPKPHLLLVLGKDSIQFLAPVEVDRNKQVLVVLKDTDINHMKVHFGKCLPILFIYTTPQVGVNLVRTLKLRENCQFDPRSSDPKRDKITVLIDYITDDHRKFLRNVFPGENKLEEIDQKKANEILVKSTPTLKTLEHATASPTGNRLTITEVTDSSIQRVTRSSPIRKKPNFITVENTKITTIKLDSGGAALRDLVKGDNQGVTINTSETPVQNTTPQRVRVINLPIITEPVVNIITYPPPPMTGGIPITNEDMNCLNEEEFLNDVIIDFYLKYVFHEKLSEYHREKTHVFSTYFYPRLTHAPEKVQGEDSPMQFRRHNQVKKWTKHVDIFSKDFIVVPVNLNAHWFLAIICYPGNVPEKPFVSNKDMPKDVTSRDNVTSSDEQDDSSPKGQSINEVSEKSNPPHEDNSNSTNSSPTPYTVEEPPDSEDSTPDAPTPDTPDSSTHPADSHQKRKETPCICIFDSLNGRQRWRIASTLREYLEVEWKLRKGTARVFDRNTMQGFIIKCPQQNNYSDCGLYLLQYVESFFETPIPYFENPMPDMTDWFSDAKIANKRTELKELIFSLQKKQEKNTNARKVEPISVSSCASQQMESR